MKKVTKKQLRQGFEDETRYTPDCGVDVPLSTKIVRLLRFQGERFGFFGKTKKETIDFAYMNQDSLKDSEI